MRDFEIINDILTDLEETIYNMTKIAADEYYKYGKTDLLKVASEKSGLSADEILCLW